MQKKKQEQKKQKLQISQSNSIECFISELLIFVKLLLKINNKFFLGLSYYRQKDPKSWSLFERIYSQTQLNAMHWIVIDQVGLPNSVWQHNLMDCFQLHSICSTEWYWFGNQTRPKFSEHSILLDCQTQSNSIHWLNLL